MYKAYVYKVWFKHRTSYFICVIFNQKSEAPTTDNIAKRTSHAYACTAYLFYAE